MTPKQPIHIKWNWQLSSNPEQLWMYVADINRLFKNMNLPSILVADTPNGVKKDHPRLSYNSIKYSDIWTEEPAEWEYPYRYSIRRTYKSGPLKEAKIQVDLFPNGKGTRLQYQLWVKPKHFLTAALSAFKYKTIWRTRLRKIFNHYDGLIQKNCLPYQARNKKNLFPGVGKRLDNIRKSLTEITGREDITNRLIEFIQRAEDIDLIRIEPFRLADHWQLERKDVLHVFLHASREGLLHFNWDLYCPSCRTIQQVCKSLNEVHEHVYCNECCSEFAINFNQSIQLSFCPNPLIRRTRNNNYCYASPYSKPHIAVQQHLKAGQKRYLKTHLEQGTYYLRVFGSRGRATVLVDEEGHDTVSIRLSSRGLKGEQAHICSKPNLTFENNTQKGQTFILEKADWRNTGVTAARATSLQVFRDLFTGEVLQKGEQVGVDKLTLMFTDLLDSTAMYHKEGDNEAVGHVIEHFEILKHAVAKENGALVKTIGDSIMAVFSNTEQAFRAFITAQKMMFENMRFGKSLKLKAGIHHGSCVAVNLNNHIDYFGSTVNIASRLADLANENEIILSESVAKSNKVHQLLAANMLNFTLEQESVNLKGFEETFNIERVRLEKPHLRLAI